MTRRTQRVWRTIVGLVGPADVRELQDKVARYRYALQGSLAKLAEGGTKLATEGKYTDLTWLELVERCKAFEAEGESGWNPVAYLTAGSAYDRGRQLIAELDGWRDELVRLKAPGVPEPIPVPNSDLGIAGGIGIALLAVVAILALREMRRF